MQVRIIFTLLCMLIIEPIWANNIWQCVAHDQQDKEWVGNSAYERVASNKAIEACKKESRRPVSCTVDDEACYNFVNGKKLSSAITREGASWQCTALDQKAKVWTGDSSIDRDEAAMTAKAYCQEHSKLPDTCYINFLMCKKTSL